MIDTRKQMLIRLLERNNLYHLIEMINNGTDAKMIFEEYEKIAASRIKNRRRDTRNRSSSKTDFKKIRMYLRLLGTNFDCGC